MKIKHYTAPIVLAVLWLGFWAGHAWFSYRHALHDSSTHMQPFEAGEFWVEWAKDSFENNQSEMLQVLVAAWVFKHFLWEGSPESKDTQ